MNELKKQLYVLNDAVHLRIEYMNSVASKDTAAGRFLNEFRAIHNPNFVGFANGKQSNLSRNSLLLPNLRPLRGLKSCITWFTTRRTEHITQHKSSWRSQDFSMVERGWRRSGVGAPNHRKATGVWRRSRWILGVWRWNPQPLEARIWGRRPQHWRFLQLFNKNNTFLCIFRPKYSYLF